MLRRRLAKHGYEMIVAEDGQKGIEAALREKPDLILMDLSLPVLTGWEAAQQLKESAQTQAIPIIALSAHALEGERDKALAANPSPRKRMNESRSLIRNSARSSDRLWLACRISTRNISTWSKGGRPPRERSARGTALSRSGRKSSKSTKPFSRSSVSPFAESSFRRSSISKNPA